MLRTMLKSKIHGAFVTQTDLEYEGSIALDPVLLDAAGISDFEQVHVWNITNGQRLVTYAITGERGSGQVCLNGAAARLASKGDKVIIACFAALDEDEAKEIKPIIVKVDRANRVTAKECGR